MGIFLQNTLLQLLNLHLPDSQIYSDDTESDDCGLIVCKSPLYQNQLEDEAVYRKYIAQFNG